MTNDDILKEIQARQSTNFKASEVTKNHVIKELSKGAFASLDTSEMRYSDKIKCLELLCKHFGLLEGQAVDERDPERIRKKLSIVLERLNKEKSV